MKGYVFRKHTISTFIIMLLAAYSSDAFSYGLGIDYDSTMGQNEIRRVDLTTGTSSVINHVQFSSGHWLPWTLSVDVSSGEFYAISMDNTLYTFNLKTGSVITTKTLSVSLNAAVLGNTGTLVGITYNSASKSDDIYRIDIASGTATRLNSVNFGGVNAGAGRVNFTYVGTGWNIYTLASDRKASRLYVSTSNYQLYTFDLTTGSLLKVSTLPTETQGIIYGEKNILLAISYDRTSNTDKIYHIDTTKFTKSVYNSIDFGYSHGGFVLSRDGLFFGTGWKTSTFSSDPSSGFVYIADGSQKLHSFNLNTVATDANPSPAPVTLDFSPQVLVAVPNFPSLSAWLMDDQNKTITKPDIFQVDGSPASATIPLGGIVSFKLTVPDASGSIAPVKSTFSVSQPVISPLIKNPTQSLFKDKVVIAFGKDSDSITTKQIQAIHLGKAKLTITPEDTSIQPITVNITVTSTQPNGQPIALGKDNNTYDIGIMKIAHDRGIPPQFIKGQMSQESKTNGKDFNPYAYRYEPLSSYGGDYGTISTGKNYRTHRIYEDYRLATSDHLATGVYTNSNDIAARTKASPTMNFKNSQGKIVYLPSTIGGNDPISIKQILDADPTDKFKWCKNSSARLCSVDPISNKPTLNLNIANILSNITAQTSLAASYGLLQIMYVTAIDGDFGDPNSKWSGIKGRFNPSFLFDTPYNIANGGGSISLGTYKTYKNFKVTQDTLSNTSKFTVAFQKSFQSYNPNLTGYGASVISKSRGYIPTAIDILK